MKYFYQVLFGTLVAAVLMPLTAQDSNADGWTMETPYNMQQIRFDAAVTGSGGAPKVNLDWVFRVVQGTTVHGSTQGTSKGSTSAGTWAGSINAPTGGWTLKGGAKTNYTAEVNASGGGTESVTVVMTP